MKENKIVQTSSTARIKKTLHLITVVAFFLQQLVPYSPAFAMWPEEENNNNNTSQGVRFSPASSPSSLHNSNNNNESPLIPRMPSANLQIGEALQEGLERLNQKIIAATEAKEDLPYALAIKLKSQLERLTPEDRAFMDKLIKNLISPEEILWPTESTLTHPLATIPVLSLQHSAFQPIHALCKDLEKAEALFPSLDKELKKTMQYYTDFITCLSETKSENRAGLLDLKVHMSLEGFGHYLISASMARQLLSFDLYGGSTKEKNFKAGHQEGGQNAVFGREGVHFKADHGLESDLTKPLDPLIPNIRPEIQWAVHAFSELLFGSLTPPSLTLVLKNVPLQKCEETKEGKEAQKKFDQAVKQPLEEKRLSSESFFAENLALKRLFHRKVYMNTFLQATETVDGQSLNGFLLKKGALNELEKRSITSSFLLGLLCRLTDAKEDNLFINKSDQIVSIDNDHAFANMIVGCQDSINQKEFSLIQTKNTLFLMNDLMTKPIISQDIKSKMMERDPDLFLLQWLFICELQNKRYEALRKETGVNALSHILFVPEEAQKIQNDLFLLQTAFPQAQTHQDLLESVSPLGGAYYKKLRELYSDPLDATHKLWEAAPPIEDFLNGSPLLQNLEREKASRDQYVYSRKHTPLQEAQLLLDKIDLQKKPSETRLEILSLVFQDLSWPQSWTDPHLLLTLAKDVLGSNLSTRSQLMNFLLYQTPFDLSTKDEDDNTLLHFWANSSLEIDKNIIRAWKEARYDLDALNKKEESPFDVALEKDKHDLLEALLEQGGGRSYHEASLEKYFHRARGQDQQSLKRWKGLPLQKLFHTRKEQDGHFAWVLKRTKFLSPHGSGEECEILTLNPQRKGQAKGVSRIQPERRFISLHSQLWDEKGNFKAIHENSATKRKVGWILLDEYKIFADCHPSLGHQKVRHNRIYFKQNPASVGTSLSIMLLEENLFGQSTLPLTFAKIKGTAFTLSPGVGRLKINTEKEAKKPFPPLKHSWIEEGSLHTILKTEDPWLEDHPLDDTELAQSILMAIITNPEDGKPSNYVLERIRNQNVYSRVIGIDEEQAFVPSAERAPQ